MLPFPEILHNFILPAIIVGVLLLLAWWPWTPTWHGRWIGSCAISVGYAVAACAIGGTPRWPPGTGDVAFWLIWFTIPVALLGLLDALLRPPWWLRAGILLVLSWIAVRLLVAPRIAHAPGKEVWLMEAGAYGADLIVVLWWLAVETLAEQLPRAMFPIILLIVAAGFAAVLGTSDSVKPSLAAAALAGMALAPAVLAVWPIPNLSLGRGAVLGFVMPLLGSLVVLYYYSYTEPPVFSIVLLLIAPLLAWVADLPGIRRLGRWRVAIRIVLVLLAVGAACGLSVRQSMHAKAAANSTSSEQDEY